MRFPWGHSTAECVPAWLVVSANLPLVVRRWGHSTAECVSPGATLPLSAFPLRWGQPVCARVSFVSFHLHAQDLLDEVVAAYEDAKGKERDTSDFGTSFSHDHVLSLRPDLSIRKCWQPQREKR